MEKKIGILIAKYENYISGLRIDMTTDDDESLHEENILLISIYEEVICDLVTLLN